jgi:hypothetical protein
MLDPSSFGFTGEENYLNHPSPYYVLLARIGPALEGRPEAILYDRLINVLLGAIGLGALMAVGLVAKLPRLTLYAYIVPIAAIPVLAPLAGAIIGRGSSLHSAASSSHPGRSSPRCCWSADWSAACCSGYGGAGGCRPDGRG